MSDVIRRNTPTTYQAMRITLQLPQNGEGEIVPLVDFAIRNADGVIIDEDHPAFTLTANEQSVVKTWSEDEEAAYEAETGLARYGVEPVKDYGFLPGLAGHLNTPAAMMNTLETARGLAIPNASFRHPLNDLSSTIESYDAWCADLAESGTKMIRVRMSGWNAASRVVVYDLEPPPHGRYNIWHSALDDSDLATFRSHQVSGSPGDETFPIGYWESSNVKELLDACDKHKIGVILCLSHNSGWSASHWRYHAWNINNYYLNGDRCQEEDRGFLTDRTEVFTNPLALQALKDRISFVIRLVGGYECVRMWGVSEEGSWCSLPAFWGRERFDAEQIRIVRQYVTPWWKAVAEHIQEEDPHGRPVMSSVAHSPAKLGYIWPDNPDQAANVRMEPLVVDPISIVATNCYQPGFREKVLHLNAIRRKVHPKLVMVHQYFPPGWSLGADADQRIEEEPFMGSKRVEWLGAVLPQSIGPGRWPGMVESEQHNTWIEGGYDHPGFRSFGAVTEQLRSIIDWSDWDDDPVDWEARLASAGLDYSISTGDGNHFVGLLVWTSPGQKTLTVTGIADGDWAFQVFDWTSGAISATAMSVAAGGSASVDVVPSTYNQAVVYGEKKD